MQEQPKESTVPAGTPDPIQHVLDSGRKIIELAVEWGFETTDSVYRLKRYAYVPQATTAEKMAETFGWSTGDVIEHWLPRVRERDAEAKAVAS